MSKPDKLLAGEYVSIVQPVKVWLSRESRHEVKLRTIPGRVDTPVDGRPDVYWIVHYGPPNHFSKPGSTYGLFRVQVGRSHLIRRDPDYDDPLEL